MCQKEAAFASMTISFSEHPDRRKVVSEMHLRRWPEISAPSLIFQFLRIVTPEERILENEILKDLPSDWDLDQSEAKRHYEGSFKNKRRFVWEQHSEATSITLFIKPSSQSDFLASKGNSDLLEACEFLSHIPGQVVRATLIFVVEGDADAEELLPSLEFSVPELISCSIGRNKTSPPKIWSDFRIGNDGFGQLLVAANGCSPRELSRLIQRLQELGNYRNLALLGLPIARSAWHELNEIEGQLCKIAGDVAQPDTADDLLLEQVSALSLALISHSTRIGFRMGATAAYAQLVEDRLEELRPRSDRHVQSLNDFTQRRLLPAVRTCSALVRREAELSQRASGFASLLRTRIEVRIQKQNADMLASMERNAALQIRMQRMVEGLSVIALSYYALGLASYIIKGLETHIWLMSYNVIMAIMVPFTLLLTSASMHSIRRIVS